MAKITGNTTATPMAVPDLAQTDERKANYIKNKKVSYLENDIGYAEKTYVDGKVGEIDEALNEIIALQELYIRDNAPDIKFYVGGNECTAKENDTWKYYFSIQENVDNIGYSDYGDGLVRIYGGVFWVLYNDGTTVQQTDEIIADYDYQITNE